jgi:uncharacterized protein YlxP (DUF503 family)
LVLCPQDDVTQREEFTPSRRLVFDALTFLFSPMVIAALTAELAIDGADSLKDKRQVLKSLLAHLRREFNISASEVGDHDIWRSAVIGIAVVATETAFANAVLDKAIDHIEREPRVSLGHYEIEML